MYRRIEIEMKQNIETEIGVEEATMTYRILKQRTRARKKMRRRVFVVLRDALSIFRVRLTDSTMNQAKPVAENDKGRLKEKS